MSKIDLKKDLKALYTASAKRAALVDVPKLKCLMIDGVGDPNNSPLFQGAMEALYGVAYTLKFGLKLDYTVMPAEGLWWADGEPPFDMANKAAWKWTLLMVVPDLVTAAMVGEAKKKKDVGRVAEVRLESFREGPAVQILHVGPYAEEGPTVARLHQFAAESGYTLAGKHHEIYFSDPRRSKPEKMRTILRQPVKSRTGD
jgi:hypothetical protein